MKFWSKFLFLVVFTSACLTVSNAQPAAGSDFSSLLSLFSAHAISPNGVRINWSLDSLAPTIVKFRLYRGFTDVGSFAVLTEIDPHGGVKGNDYSYTDETALPGVTYYYKIASQSQANESVFPVVISATPDAEASKMANSQDLVPASILQRAKLTLYVRRAGRVKLVSMAPKQATIVDDVLKPGIYEFDTPAGVNGKVKLKLHHDEGYDSEPTWSAQ